MHQNNVSAVTAVSRDTFVNARPVGGAAVRVNAQQLQNAEIERRLPVAPERRSVIGSGAPATVRPPDAVMRRQVIAKEPPPAPPVSFQRRQQVLTANPGSAPTQQQMDQLRGQPQQQDRRGFTSFGRGNQNAPQSGNVPQQQPVNPQRGGQVQQQPPTGTFTAPNRGNQSAPQPENVPQQQPVNPQRGGQMQQQPPIGTFTPPTRGNQNPSQAGNDSPRQRGNQPPAQQPPQIPQQQAPPQQPPVKLAPPARVNEDTYHPHQFGRPQQAPPPQSERAPEKVPEKAPEKPAEKAPERGQSHGQDNNRQGNSDQEKRQPH